MTALDRVNEAYAAWTAADEEVKARTAEANVAARTPNGHAAYVAASRALVDAIVARQQAQDNYARALTMLRLEAARSGKAINATR